MRLRVCVLTEIKRYKSAIRIRIGNSVVKPWDTPICIISAKCQEILSLVEFSHSGAHKFLYWEKSNDFTLMHM